MGTYLNPDNDLFKRSVNSKIYVDKSRLIHFTNDLIHSKDNFVCVSRPRRFGKSMALEMLNAYYSKGCDSAELFKSLKVGIRDENDPDADMHLLNYEKNMNTYDVIYIDLQGIIGKAMQSGNLGDEVIAYYKSVKDMTKAELNNTKHPKLTAIQRMVIKDIREHGEYAQYVAEDEQFLGNALQSISKATGNKFILLIDEWDCLFRNDPDDTLIQDKYIEWLRDMFKNTELLNVYAFVYMTGILPIKRYGTESALNNFDEYTFLEPLIMADFAGFTKDEVRKLCKQYNVSLSEMNVWYNGYVFEDVGRIYNPRSVVSAIINKKFKNYWTTTGTYETVKKQIEMNFEGLKEKVVIMLGGGRCKIDINGFQNDMVTFENADDVLTFLVHLGYLGYDAVTEEVYIPNKEIRGEFVRSIRGEKYARTYEAVAKSAELLKATLEGDENTVAEMIEQAHTEHASILKYNDENALSCIVQIAYYQAQDDYKLFRELPSGKGFADVVFLPRPGRTFPAIVVELKWNDNAIAAIDQIKNRQYGEALKDYIGEVLLVGVSYDKDIEKGNKKHTCKIERVRMRN